MILASDLLLSQIYLSGTPRGVAKGEDTLEMNWLAETQNTKELLHKAMYAVNLRVDRYISILSILSSRR